MSKLNGLLVKAQRQKTGDHRTAAHGGQGHQKTPAFIEALIKDTFLVLEHPSEGEATADNFLADKQHLPKGGFTDVGMHTGAEGRGTCWPLVREMTKVINNI